MAKLTVEFLLRVGNLSELERISVNCEFIQWADPESEYVHCYDEEDEVVFAVKEERVIYWKDVTADG